jgi:hypothetical protein
MTHGNTYKELENSIKKRKKINFLIAIITGLIIGAAIGISILAVSNRRTEVGIVTSKEVKRINKEDTYLIYTESEDGEINVYEITDSLVHFRFNSADVYGGIKEGHTYEFEVVGIRSGIMSLYPNILEYKEIK